MDAASTFTRGCDGQLRRSEWPTEVLSDTAVTERPAESKQGFPLTEHVPPQCAPIST